MYNGGIFKLEINNSMVSNFVMKVDYTKATQNLGHTD